MKSRARALSFFSRRRSSLRDPRAGQAVIEYLLGIALALGVIMGVLYPVMKQKFDEIQNRIVTSASGIVAQDELGMPYRWFFGAGIAFEQTGTLAGGGGGAAPAGADGAKDPSGNGRGGGGNGGGGGNNDGAKPAGAGGFNPGANNGKSLSSGRGGASGATGSVGDEGGGEAPDGETVDKRPAARGGGGDGDKGFGGGAQDGEGVTGESQSLTATEESGKEEEGSGGITGLKKEKDSERAVRRSRGGCEDVNVFTLLKIAAIVLILLLVGAVALSGRGNSAKD